MKQYLLSIYQPDGPPPADLDLSRIMRDVHALRDDHLVGAVSPIAFEEGESGYYTPGVAHVDRLRRGLDEEAQTGAVTAGFVPG